MATERAGGQAMSDRTKAQLLAENTRLRAEVERLGRIVNPPPPEPPEEPAPKPRVFVLALNTPTVLHGWPGFADDGSPLDAATVTERRDGFLRTALDQLPTRVR